jgi:transposase
MDQGSPTTQICPEQLPPVCGTPPMVPALTLVSITQKELTEYKQKVNFYSTQLQRACKREALLKEEIVQLKAQACEQAELHRKEIEQLEAKIHDLKHRHYGDKSEAGSTPTEKKSGEGKVVKRPRGHQLGAKGHGRTERPELPIVEEVHELHDKCCDRCGLRYNPLKGDEESKVLEIQVKAYTRHIKRKRYIKSCSCPPTPESPKIVVAPPPPKVIPKSNVGTSILVYVLIHKYLYGTPLNRILSDFANSGMPIAAGTLTGDLKKITALFRPLQEAFYQHQMTELLFHNDESRWKVFCLVEGKTGYRWWLWVTRSLQVIYFTIDSTRSAAIPMAHFAGLQAKKVVMVCDRYSAYKMLARLNEAIILAFCWVHVRRDFINLGIKFPSLKEWGEEWVVDIGKLYHLNKLRLAQWQENLPFDQQNELFKKVQQQLEKHIEYMKERCEELLMADVAVRTTVKLPPAMKAKSKKPSEPHPQELHEAQRKLLASLQRHWHGLIVFVTLPYVPMDNNLGEQAIRGPVVGRKNFYGSCSEWSAELTAMMYTQLLTVEHWGLNPPHWLEDYLKACAINGGAAPADLAPFLPWKMSEERRQHLCKPSPTLLDSA